MLPSGVTPTRPASVASYGRPQQKSQPFSAQNVSQHEEPLHTRAPSSRRTVTVQSS